MHSPCQGAEVHNSLFQHQCGIGLTAGCWEKVVLPAATGQVLPSQPLHWIWYPSDSSQLVSLVEKFLFRE